jgi:hypothetical protein
MSSLGDVEGNNIQYADMLNFSKSQLWNFGSPPGLRTLVVAADSSGVVSERDQVRRHVAEATLIGYHIRM